ncbi:MAG: hypothetical protein MUF15_28185, partial [Acidobacteria bacterium]|nr:hypothetical protein [Acidobacteriota bacterium]
AKTIENYQANYDKIQENALPSTFQMMENFLKAFASICVNQVDPAIKKNIEEYLTEWAAYYKIKVDGNYGEKEEKSRQQKEALIALKTLAGQIKFFEIGGKVTEIESMIATAINNEKYWQVNKKLNNIVTEFLNSHSPSLEALYDSKMKIKNVPGYAEISLEKALENNVQSFLDLPSRDKLNIAWLKDYLSPRKKGNDNIIKVLKKEFKGQLESELERKLLDGGISLADVQAVLGTYNLYNNYFTEPTGRCVCIKKLEAYYRAKNDNNFPQMLELYREGQSILSCCGDHVSSAWHIEDKKQVESQFLTYYYQQAEEVLGNGKLMRSKDDFQQFLKLHKQIREYFKLKENENWKARSTCLNNYFNAKEQSNPQSEDKAARLLYETYPQLAKAYQIAEPQKIVEQPEEPKEKVIVQNKGKIITSTKLQPKTGTGTFTENPSIPIDMAYEELKAMWEIVIALKTEKEVVDYILTEALLRIENSPTAQNSLNVMLTWYNKWNDFVDHKERKFTALALIAEMQARAGNVQDQNSIYESIIRSLKAAGKDISLPSGSNLTIQSLEQTIQNNINFITLMNGNIRKNTLQKILKNLNFDILTPEQQVNAHYMFGQLFEKEKNIHVPPCFHYTMAKFKMANMGVSQITLLQSQDKEITESELSAKICFYCVNVNKNPAAVKELDKQYPNRNFILENIIRDCSATQPVIDDPQAHKPIDTKDENSKYASQNEDLLKFMDTLLVNQSQFEDTVKFYRANLQIPESYNCLMNQLFHVLYDRGIDWKKQADDIFKEGNWNEEIKEKVKNIITKIKLIYH